MTDAYKSQDAMYLWWLGDGTAQRPIGRIFLADGNGKVGLEYESSWLENGFPLSDDLPMVPGAFLPKVWGMAVGAVNDARPGRWGERIIRSLYKPVRLSVLECLYFAGDHRFGALGVSLASEKYEHSDDVSIPSLARLPDMERAIATILAGEHPPENLIPLVNPGRFFDGTRPKSLIEMDGFQWIVKFSEGEDFNNELVEHATMRLARQCGIQAALTRALPLAHGHAVAVKRFDRDGDKRFHVISADTVLRAADLPLGYPELAQCLQKITRPDDIGASQKELFRRMVFNILIDNTDDHERNHAFIRAPDGYYDLSPAYDVVPSVQGLGQQQMGVGSQGTDSSIENALSQVDAFGLKKGDAVAIVHKIATCVDGWRLFFQSQGVSARDLKILAQYIDGSTLRSQRADFLP